MNAIITADTKQLRKYYDEGDTIILSDKPLTTTEFYDESADTIKNMIDEECNREDIAQTIKDTCDWVHESVEKYGEIFIGFDDEMNDYCILKEVDGKYEVLEFYVL